jgi:hypothetical protein
MRVPSLLAILILAAPLAPRAADDPPPAAAAPAATAAPASPSTATAAATPPASTPSTEEPYPHFGVMLALGVPDGAVLSFVGSPWYWLLLDAGFAYTLAPGFVVGATFQPIDFVISPTLRAEYGYYFAGNTATLVKSWAGVPENLQPLINDASYDWFSALLGIALGSRRGFTFRLEGGVGWLSLNVKGGTTTQSDGTVVTLAGTKFKAFGPMARLSFAYYF